MKTLTNEKELFALFVNEESDRDFTRKPFYNPRYNEVWATNAHILLMIKDYENKPDFVKEFNRPESGEAIFKTLKIEELKALLERVILVDEVKKIECEECGGSGIVKWEYYSYKQHHTYYSDFDCPVCEGYGYSQKYKTGRKVIAEDESIFINGVIFAAKYINVLAQTMKLLGLKAVKWINSSPRKGNVFELNEDVRVMIMPKLG